MDARVISSCQSCQNRKHLKFFVNFFILALTRTVETLHSASPKRFKLKNSEGVLKNLYAPDATHLD